MNPVGVQIIGFYGRGVVWRLPQRQLLHLRSTDWHSLGIKVATQHLILVPTPCCLQA
jgi:hypothetical protein